MGAKLILEALACEKDRCSCRQAAKRGHGLTHCPAHADKVPSLSVHTVQDGKVLVKCHSDCAQDVVIAALEGKGLWPKSSQGKASKGRIIVTYDYQDEAGRLLFQVVRYDPKDFKQRRPDRQGGWVWNLEGVDPVLYRLPELLKAPSEALVFVPEGEKDVGNLRGLGLVATTSPMGAGKWRPEYAESLRGRHVVILADNDEPGRQHAQMVAASLLGVAPSFKVLELPGLPEKGDVSDWLQAGGTKEQLLKLVSQIPQFMASVPKPLPEILDAVSYFLKRFVKFQSEHQVVAVTLWTAHTFTFEAADATPYLAITSPEKRSGKTRLLEALALLVHKPWVAILPSEAVIFRKVEADRPTLLLDETDAIFRNPPPPQYEPLRALLNSGHRRGARVPRCLGRGADLKLVEFSVFCPKALAGMGSLPATIVDRSIPIRLSRRAPGEDVERFHQRAVEPEADKIRRALSEWAQGALTLLKEARPEVSFALNDRAIDGWEPLLAIADLAGGAWPTKAREAALSLNGDGAVEEESAGVLLLAHVREAFDEAKADRMTSSALLLVLIRQEDGPWPEWWGQKVTEGNLKGPASKLARLLRPYGVRPQKLRVGEDTAQGYTLRDFSDAFSRYLPAPSSLLGTSTRNNGTPAMAQIQNQLGTSPPKIENVPTLRQIQARLECSVVPSSNPMEEKSDTLEV